MPTYQIEQYEIHAQTFQVEAPSAADAIAKLLKGGACPVDDGLDYIEVCNSYGLPVQEHADLAAQLRSLGVAVGDDVIPSIRSITEEDD